MATFKSMQNFKPYDHEAQLKKFETKKIPDDEEDLPYGYCCFCNLFDTNLDNVMNSLRLPYVAALIWADPEDAGAIREENAALKLQVETLLSKNWRLRNQKAMSKRTRRRVRAGDMAKVLKERASTSAEVDLKQQQIDDLSEQLSTVTGELEFCRKNEQERERLMLEKEAHVTSLEQMHALQKGKNRLKASNKAKIHKLGTEVGRWKSHADELQAQCASAVDLLLELRNLDCANCHHPVIESTSTKFEVIDGLVKFLAVYVRRKAERAEYQADDPDLQSATSRRQIRFKRAIGEEYSEGPGEWAETPYDADGFELNMCLTLEDPTPGE
ncbi:unnamed protein product, partial [Mesorhabditis spiculigera]